MRSRSVTTPAAMRTDGERSMAQRMKGLVWARPGVSVFMLALIVRAFIAVVLTRYFSGTLVLDDTTYHKLAADMAAGQSAYWDAFAHQLYWTTATFTLPVTALYKVFGPVPLVAQLMIGVVGAATALFVTRLTAEFLATGWALVAGLLVALLPSQAFWSSMLMKDAFVWFVLTGLALTVVVAGRSTGRKLVAMGIFAALFLVALCFLRLHTLVVASWALMIASFVGIKVARVPRVAGAIAIGVFVPWIAGQIGPAGMNLITSHGSLGERRFANAVGANTAIVDTGPNTAIVDTGPNTAIVDTGPTPATDGYSTALQDQASVLVAKADRAEARAADEPSRKAELSQKAERLRERARRLSDLAAQANKEPPVGSLPAEGPLDANVRHLPRGLSVMLVEPTPVPFSGSISLRLARIESLLWYPLLLFAGIGLWRVRPHLRQMAFPLLVGGGIVLMYALSEGNVGTAHRHRGEFVWVVALLATTGLAHIVQSRRTISEEAA